jgi:hypothetical protein
MKKVNKVNDLNEKKYMVISITIIFLLVGVVFLSNLNLKFTNLKGLALSDGSKSVKGFWQSYGDDIYYDKGSVGINLKKPSSELDVAGEITSDSLKTKEIKAETGKNIYVTLG